MIPKIIHYCWLSNDPIPQKLLDYMKSWKDILPDYELMLWNFDRFNKDSSLWVKQAFDNKKYAFAADYIRLFALYNYGGIYLDMDVEVLKDFAPLLKLKSFFCWQNAFSSPESPSPGLEVAAMGVEKGCPWIRLCLDRYSNRPFVSEHGFDMKPLPHVVESVLRENNISLHTVQNIDEAVEFENKGIPVFTCDFFSPKSFDTGIIEKTKNTYCIHHFSGSWCKKKSLMRAKVYQFLRRNFGESVAKFVRKIFGKRKK